jgi:hypothetical protein
MHQLIGIALVLALALAVMPALVSAQHSGHIPLLSLPPSLGAQTMSVGFWNDKGLLRANNASAREQLSGAVNKAEPADDADPTSFLGIDDPPWPDPLPIDEPE